MNMQCSCCNSVDQAGAQLGFGSEESVDSQCLRSFGSGRNCQGFARIFFVPRLQNFYQRTTSWVMPRMEACDLLSSERSMVLETQVPFKFFEISDFFSVITDEVQTTSVENCIFVFFVTEKGADFLA